MNVSDLAFPVVVQSGAPAAGSLHPIEARPLPSRAVAERFPKAGRRRISLIAFGYWVTFYGGFVLYVRGVLPAWLFATAGLFVFIRYFDATHEEIHVRQDDHPAWTALRLVFSVSGPLQLGYTQLAASHRQHHAYEGTARDPDLWIMRAGWFTAVFHCLTQPEQAAVRYIRRNGIDRRLVFDLALHLGFWLALACVCTWPQFLLYNAVVRVGNGASWFVFTHLLHRASAYRDFDPLPLPVWLRAAWLVLIGRNNLNAISYHFLHHAYGFVPSLGLPELGAQLRTCRKSTGLDV